MRHFRALRIAKRYEHGTDRARKYENLELPFVSHRQLASQVSNHDALAQCNSDELSWMVHGCSKEDRDHKVAWGRMMEQVVSWDASVPLRHACRVLSAMCALNRPPSKELCSVIDAILARGTDANDLAGALSACAQLRWTPPSTKIMVRTIQDMPDVLEVQSCIVLLNALPNLKAPLEGLMMTLENVLVEKVAEFMPIDCGSLVQTLANTGRGDAPLFANTLRRATMIFPTATSQQIANLCNAVAKTEKDVPWFWEAVFLHLRHRDWKEFTAQGLTTICQAMSRMQVSDDYVLQQIIAELPAKDLNEAELALLANGLSNLGATCDTLVSRIVDLQWWSRLGHLAMVLKALGKWGEHAAFDHCVTCLAQFPPAQAAWIDVADVALGGQHINQNIPWVSHAVARPAVERRPKARPLGIIALALASVKGGDIAAWEGLASFVSTVRDVSPPIYATLCRAFHKVASSRKDPFETVAQGALNTLKEFDISASALTPADLAICLFSLQTQKMEDEALRRAVTFGPKHACLVLSGLRSNPKAFAAFWDRRAFSIDVLKTWDAKELVQLKALLETDKARCALGSKRAQHVCTQLKHVLSDTELFPSKCVDLLGACSAPSEARRLITFVQENASTFTASELAQALAHVSRLRAQVQGLHSLTVAIRGHDAQTCVAACASMDIFAPPSWIQATLDSVLPQEPKLQVHLAWAMFQQWPREGMEIACAAYSSNTWSTYEQKHFQQMAYDWHLMRGDWNTLRLPALRTIFEAVSLDMPPMPPITSVLQNEVGNSLPGSWIPEASVGLYRCDFIGEI